MVRVGSDDAVLREVGRRDTEAAEAWLWLPLDCVPRPLPQEGWILDIDTTVKSMHGRQASVLPVKQNSCYACSARGAGLLCSGCGGLAGGKRPRALRRARSLCPMETRATLCA